MGCWTMDRCLVCGGAWIGGGEDNGAPSMIGALMADSTGPAGSTRHRGAVYERQRLTVGAGDGRVLVPGFPCSDWRSFLGSLACDGCVIRRRGCLCRNGQRQTAHGRSGTAKAKGAKCPLLIGTMLGWSRLGCGHVHRNHGRHGSGRHGVGDHGELVSSWGCEVV